MRTSVITLTSAALTACLLTAGGPSSAGPASPVGAVVAAAAADPASARTTLTARCLDAGTELSVEERRLENRLPRNGNPALAQLKPFARQMIEGGGFEAFGPRLVQRLCETRSLAAAERLAERQGRALWRQAVRRAQSTGPVAGGLPASDDRPLYWTRLQATAALRQWQPSFRISIDERDSLITRFDKAARGMGEISFTPGRRVTRVLVSGFDPYTLDGGETGTGNDTVGNNIRHGNPSGAAALALDGTTYRTKGGKRQVIEAYTLPVNYTEFAAGYVEDTVGPHMTARPRRRVDASITVSQAVDSEFRLEQWNARYHGDFAGNDLSLPCPGTGPDDATPQLAVDNPGCNTAVPRRWGGTLGFELRRPPQWTTASLPVGAMIRANTGADVPRPPGDTWPDTSVAFGVIWHTRFTRAHRLRVERDDRAQHPGPDRLPARAAADPALGGLLLLRGRGRQLPVQRERLPQHAAARPPRPRHPRGPHPHPRHAALRRGQPVRRQRRHLRRLAYVDRRPDRRAGARGGQPVLSARGGDRPSPMWHALDGDPCYGGGTIDVKRGRQRCPRHAPALAAVRLSACGSQTSSRCGSALRAATRAPTAPRRSSRRRAR